MSVRLSLVLSEDLNSAIEKTETESGTEKSEIIRKSLQLFLAAQDGKRRGLKLGLCDPDTGQMQTEFIGL